MKVIFFTFGVLEQGGGFENFLIKTTRSLKDSHKDLDITIVTSSDRLTKKLQSLLSIYFVKKIEAENMYREDINDIVMKLGKVKYLKLDSFKEMKRVLKDCDVLHAKNEIIELSILKTFGFKNLPPTIMGIHTPILYPYKKSVQSRLHNVLYPILYKHILRNIDGIYVQNDHEYNYLKNGLHYRGLLAKINQAVPVKREKIVHQDSKNFRVLFVGRITEQKGVDVLIDCITELSTRDDFEEFEFRIAGTGDNDLISIIEKLCSEFNNVKYLGHVAHDEVQDLYKWSDCVVIPSRFETLCMVAIEAALNGKLSIASEIPGPSETITNNKTGYLIPLNKTAFSSKLIEVKELRHKNPLKYNLIGEAAQLYVLAKFDPKKAIESLNNMLRNAYERS